MIKTLRAKLIGGFGMLVILLLLCGGVGLFGVHKLTSFLTFLTGPSWNAADGAMNAQNGIQYQFVALSRMNAGEEGYQDELAKGEARVQDAFNLLKTSNLIPANRMSSLESQLQEFNRKKSDLQSDIYNGGYVQQLHEVTTKLLGDLAALEDLDDQRMTSQKQSIASTLTQLDMVLITVPAISIAIALAIIYLVVIKSVKNIEAVTKVASSIAGGDLRDSQLTVNSQDEVGELQRSIENMRRLLATSIGDVKSSADQLASAAEEMSSITKEGGKKVHEQSRQTESLGQAVERMTNSFKAVANNTMEARDLAESAQSDAHSGQTIVSESIRSMNTLTENVMNACQTIEQLSQDSDRIGNVLDVIRGIADQTNLLALNAAIEAARAGEMGRGFAVVADEVRTLAQRTQESTHEIQEVIAHLQQRVKEVVQVMESGQDQAQNSSVQVSAAGESLQTVFSKIQSLNSINAQIADEAQQQSAVADAIDKNIQTITEIANQTSTSSEQINQASNELARLAANLNTMTDRFRV